MRKLIGALALFGCLSHGPAFAQKAPILVGQSASLTGGQAQYGKDVQQGIEAAFAAINAHGGVRGRPMQLVTLDDGGKKEAVQANTKKLVEQKVVALIGYTSGAGVEATLPLIESANIPMVGPVTGNMGIRANFHRQLFHVRAGYSDEMRKMVNHLALIGLTRFALAYLGDVGPANPQSMTEALKAHKLQAVASVALNRNAESFDKEAETLLKGEPEIVLFIANAKPIVKIVEAMRKRGYTGQFAMSSFAGLSVMTDLKGGAAAGLILSQVLPPASSQHLKVVADYRSHLNAVDPKATPNYTSLEGYVAARVLVEGLKRAGDLSGAKVIAGLESLQAVDLGGYEINFSPTSHHGSRYVNTGVVTRDGLLRF